MANDDAELNGIAEPNTILRGLVDSSVHGLVLDGTDDRDEMGVCVEPRRYVVGFGKVEQWVYRSAPEREGRAGARSRAGDLDLTIYSLRKWARLALQGNPTVLLLLYLPDDADLVDLLLVRQHERVDTGALQDAIKRVFTRRQTHAVPTRLSPAPRELAVSYRREAERVGVNPTLAEAHQLLADWVDPLLDALHQAGGVQPTESEG